MRRLFWLLCLFVANDAQAQSAWCLANPANCVCSDTYQSTSYSTVAASSGIHGAQLGAQAGTKPCFWGDFVGANASISWTFGAGDTFASMLQISTDAAILNLLPNRDVAKVARFLRFAADNNNATLRFGNTSIPLVTLGSKRLALRWYSYHSPNYQWANEGACTNGKIGHHSNGYFNYPMMTLTLHGGGQVNTSLYTFLAPGFGWLWSGHATWEGFFQGKGPRPGTAAGGATYRGVWTRHEIVVENPKASDSGGYNFHYYVKNITTGTAEVEDIRFSAGCTACMATGGPDFTWDSSIHPDNDMEALHTEFYRSGGCNGWQGWVYMDLASWNTNAGQRIGAAAEVEGGPACIACACDFDDDGVVGGADLLILATKFGKTVPTCTQGDCTNDGKVGGPDQLKMGQTFGHVGACIP